MNKKLKFSIVTAVYNGEEYIEKCILSIKNQSYKNYEHIIMDGGSTDGTLEIIKKYEGTYNMKLISQRDNGMYDAIVNGFNLSTGEVLSWLNADDMYMPWALEVVNKVMTEKNVEWCMGFPCYWDKNDVCRCQFMISNYSRNNIKNGLHDGRILPFIQQESSFWSKKLWEKANGEFIKNYDIAGDYHLWVAFAKHEALYKINSPISGFRHHSGQKSEDKDKYYSEIDKLSIYKKIIMNTKIIKLYDRLKASLNPSSAILLQNLSE